MIAWVIILDPSDRNNYRNLEEFTDINHRLVDLNHNKAKSMELIFRICLFIAGIINLTPSILAFVPNKISKSYGVEVPDSNHEILLRHRAILFGIVGGLMIYSAIQKRNYDMATFVGMISMVSFVIFYFLSEGETNSELSKVMKIDAVGIAILLIGFVLYKFK